MLIPTKQLIEKLEAIARVSNLDKGSCEICEQAAIRLETYIESEQESIFMTGYEACRLRVVDILENLGKMNYPLDGLMLAERFKEMHPSQPSPDLGETPL